VPQISIKGISNFTPYHGIWNDSSFHEEYKRDWIDDSLDLSLYIDHKYDDLQFEGEEKGGYWVEIKENNIWKQYYTGLSVNTPLFFKWDSKLKLIKNSHWLQIESALVKFYYQFDKPEKFYDYELIKDGLVTEICLDSLRKDSDHDSLTDIEERKMLLNPYSIDTDNDGIPDNLDLNPRFKRSYSEITVLYEFIYSAMLSSGFRTDTIIPSDSLKDYNKIIPNIDKSMDMTPYIFVSDDKNIQSIYPDNQGYLFRKLIVIRSKEYVYLKKKYQVLPPFIHISPLFKVDDMKDTYKIHADDDCFLIIKSANKWKIKCIGEGIDN
jgi:hypothetical protein